MKKTLFFVIAICTLVLTSCGATESGFFGKTKKKTWENSGIEILGNEILCWDYSQTDVEAEYYVKIDDQIVTTTKDEYYPLNIADFNEHKIQVGKRIENIEYVSEEVKYTKKSMNEKIISSADELAELSILGSLKSDHYILDFSKVTQNTLKIKSTIYTNESLMCLTIKGNGSLSLENFKLSIGERLSDLILIFDNIVISGNDKSLFEYTGKNSFSTDIVCYNKVSFLNTFTGSDGTNGKGASGLNSAKNGTSGMSGGSIFSLSKINMFTFNTPNFVTGNGGNGGNGGIGQGLAHGGYGGDGGNGGFVFSGGDIKCFNAKYKPLSGSFGSGGKGGIGGTGISGKRSDGSSGSAGALIGSGATITYKSSTNKTSVEEGSFEVSLFGNYLIWNEQQSVESYSIYLEGELINQSTTNCIYLKDSILSNAENKNFSVKAKLSNGDTLTSSTLEYKKLQLEAITTVPAGKFILSDKDSCEIEASNLTQTSCLVVESKVSYILIKSNSTNPAELNLNIIARDRTKSLIIVLDNVIIKGVENAATISFNDGTGSSVDTDPMLILGLFNNAAVIGKNGANGEKGTTGGLFQPGGKGGVGGSGYSAVSSSTVAVFGNGGILQAGNGGNGGDGGNADSNDIGDGGNGGNGGTAVLCNQIYVVMEDETTLNVYAGLGGLKGKKGHGMFDFGPTKAVDGSVGGTISGKYKTMNGNINTNR